MILGQELTQRHHRDVHAEQAQGTSGGRGLPGPSATPRYAAAGMVVTETATPTAELARVSSASMPAKPAMKGTETVSVADADAA